MPYQEPPGLKTANTFRFIARTALLAIGILTLLFALFSGSVSYGKGIKGIIDNFPNTIPWITLLFLLYIANRFELIGGIAITILGAVMVYFFNFSGPNFFVVTFMLTTLIVLLGLCFIMSWYFRRNITPTE